MNAEIIGRKKEISDINRYVNSGRPELIAVYGRRRVGKTFLVRELLGEHFCFYITGVWKAPLKEQLRNFADELTARTGEKQKVPKDWHEAFLRLDEYLKTLHSPEKIVFFDEIPWLDTPRSGFLREFDYFWNRNWSMYNELKFFVCGSATTWMLNKFIGDRGGLHGRVTHSIHLAPFSLCETESYLKSRGIDWERKEIMETYMVLGGIPYYLDKLDPSTDVSQNIDRLMFGNGSELREEFNFIYSSLFNESKIYIAIVKLLSKKRSGLTRDAIKKELGSSIGGKLTEYLNNLIKCDFIRSYAPFGKKSRGAIYQLTDLYSLFWLTFVSNTRSLDEHAWTNMTDTPLQNSWKGYAFEMVCLHHLPQIKQALGISGVLSQCQSWIGGDNEEKGQIDLVIVRQDRVINLCEMKYSTDEYAITKQYAEKLIRRRELFRRVTGTKYALHLTMVTTYGVKRNEHSSIIQNQVTMNNLFAY